MSDRRTLRRIFDAALREVHAGRATKRALMALPEAERAAGWTVVAAGKAAAAMAEAARRVLPGAHGCIVTKTGHGRAVPDFETREAAHPVPDSRGAEAAAHVLTLAAKLGSGDRLLVLLSGGASALLPAPAEGISLEDKQRTTELLLAHGADIAALNAVRKHLSRLKGGGLAFAAAPARSLTLAVSDVAGDAPATIGSGPTVPDPTSFATALGVLRETGIADQTPSAVLRRLEEGAAGHIPETRSAGAPCFERADFRIVASLDQALAAAETHARREGLRVHALGPVLSGDVSDAARKLVIAIDRVRREGGGLVLAGGEPTVRVTGGGRGGRAQQLALELALRAKGRFTALIAATDGTDGPTDAAGGMVDEGTLARGRESGLDAADSLSRCDAYTYLGATGDRFRTGPTDTNVTDLALILVSVWARDQSRNSTLQ